MILIFSSGRLGNQLFQYAAAKTLCNDGEWLLGIGFEDLYTGFDGIEMKIINQETLKIYSLLYKILFKTVKKIIDLLLKLKLISKISESKEKPECHKQDGLFKNLKVIQDCYFQNEFFFEQDNIKYLRIKQTLKKHAKKILEHNLPTDKTPVCVHIRRGDYCSWPSRKHPAVLSAQYYRQAIQQIKKTIINPFFIFVSDDPFYVEDIFSDLEHSYISKGNLFEDFVLMSYCKGGILSASSFAWWGAYFAKQQYSGQETIFLAPEHWFQHRLKVSRPNFVKASFLNYISAS